MIVVDASALVAALTDRAVPALFARLRGERLNAPHLVDVEVLHALRGLARSGGLSADRAADARLDYESLRLRRFGHVPLLERAWELRHSLTAYDACYVALAEVLEAPLLTCDARLAAASGHAAEVELYAPA